MRNQYSDSPEAPGPLTLALDTGSPTTSVAVGHQGEMVAARAFSGGRSSRRLLALIDELLIAHGLAPRDLEQVVAARGPGSFTGLRVGLATVLGLRQALQIRATAIGSLDLLAASAAQPADDRPLVAVIDALRGEWFARAYSVGGSGGALGEAQILPAERLRDWRPCRVVGFGLEAMPRTLAGDVELVPARPLAPTLLAVAASSDLDWDPAPLVAPHYLRPPSAAAS